MPALFLGLVILVLSFFAAKWFSKADPKHAARVLRYVLAVRRFCLPCSRSCAVKSVQHFRLGCLVSAPSAMSRSGRQALVGAHKRALVECHACAPLFWK